MMSGGLLAGLVSTFGMAFLYFWAAIPAGLALGLPPLLVILTTTLSYTLGVALVTVLGEGVRGWVLRRLGDRAVLSSDSLMGRVWQRYGVVGLGLAAPVTVGAQIGAAVGVALGAPRGRLIAWMVIGALLWSIGLTLVITLGLATVRQGVV